MRIKDKFEFLSKSKVKAGNGKEEGKYPFFTSSNIQKLYVDDSLYNCEAVILGTGGLPSCNYYNGEFSTSTDNYVLKSKGKILTKYLYYYLKNDNHAVLAAGFHGAGLKHIGKEYIQNIVIDAPEHKEQQRIIDELDLIEDAIKCKENRLKLYDEMVKARFVELFGDPMTNPMGWNKVNISAVVGGKVSNGFFAKRDDYCDEGNVKVLGVAHVVNRMYSNIEDLPQTYGSEEDIKKYGLKYGDMLFCRSSLVAAGIGKASIVPKGIPGNVLFECHVIRLPLDLDKCVPEFMQVLSTTDYFRNQVMAQSKTATMTTIGQDGILKTDIILPPLDLQKQFLRFVEQVDKSKLVLQKSLSELLEQRNALMQKYFG